MSAVSEPKLKASVIVRRLTAAALVLWMAGVGCFFGCEMGVVSAAAEADEREVVEQPESCPAFAGRDCCHKAKAESGEASGSTARRTPGHAPRTDCCPIKSQSADPARKLGVADAPLAEAGTPLKLSPHTNARARLTVHRLRVPDRGSTHLRCCVFLI
jgi:hypothetical protein